MPYTPNPKDSFKSNAQDNSDLDLKKKADFYTRLYVEAIENRLRVYNQRNNCNLTFHIKSHAYKKTPGTKGADIMRRHNEVEIRDGKDTVHTLRFSATSDARYDISPGYHQYIEGRIQYNAITKKSMFFSRTGKALDVVASIITRKAEENLKGPHPGLKL